MTIFDFIKASTKHLFKNKKEQIMKMTMVNTTGINNSSSHHGGNVITHIEARARAGTGRAGTA